MCDFCEGKIFLHSRYLDIKIDKDVPFVKSATMTAYNTNKSCPPFARCCDKDMNIEVHFEIYFCPLCGKKLMINKKGD